MFTLIIGGSASGKSEYAERLVTSLEGERVYIATMQPWDEECLRRIEKHQKARAHRGFATIECYTHLEELQMPEGSNLLLECMSNLAANEMYDPKGRGMDIIPAGVEHLLTRCRHLTIVTNEIFSGGMVYEGDTLNYMKQLGRLNCLLAARADRVVEVVCGCANVIKDVP